MSMLHKYVYLSLLWNYFSCCGDLTCSSHSFGGAIIGAADGCFGSFVVYEADVFSAVALVVVKAMVTLGAVSKSGVLFSHTDVSLDAEVLLSTGAVVVAELGFLSTAGVAGLMTFNSLVGYTGGVSGNFLVGF